jgi:tetratricopeptide (TPR) repeat protein
MLGAAATNPEYSKYPVFDYQMGAALLSRLDTGCTFYFARYLDHNKSDSYIKDTWQKMAFVWYVSNNIPKASYCLAQAKIKGTARLDADKQASRFAENNTWPLPKLLQARLLTDGGYNDRSLSILLNIDSLTLKHSVERAEYHFRLGRAYQALADNNEGKQYFVLAVNHYYAAINAGKEGHDQFAARAALQTGKMYEQIGMGREAVSKYNECLEMPAHDFQNSIDQQAKAGINRIEGKLHYL